MSMKKALFSILTACAVLTSCNGWLTQEDASAMSEDQIYSSVSSISSIAANFYSRLPLYQAQSLSDGSGLMDMARWDETCQSSSYWAHADNVDMNYRVGDYAGKYTLIREINIHIQSLQNATQISDEHRRYFIAEARFLRAMCYFDLVTILGGVPLITEPTEYTTTPIDLAKPRNKESEVYDFIADEVDAIADDLALAASGIKSRATKGAALALKCRAMLYAGSIAYQSARNQELGLYLSSGAVGIPAERANEYFEKCIDAYKELSTLGYSLYNNGGDRAENFTAAFFTSAGNPEVIFSRDFDGTTFKNYFTTKTVCAAFKPDAKEGCELSPTLNLVDDYEVVSTKTVTPIDPYVYSGTAPAALTEGEDMVAGTSNLQYKVYDNPIDIFEDRDPRLAGTVITPGSSFRGTPLDFQAGLAIKKNAEGTSWEFRTLDLMENYNDESKNTYNGQKITGLEGPHYSSGYFCHSGFLIRKFVDTAGGSEAEGSSAVPQIFFRYGEVLLNAAEAAYCLSENGEETYDGDNMRDLALELVNQVRERAGGSSFTLDADELDMDRIMNERRVELAFEDHRYYDLKRWRIADEVWHYDETNETAIMKGLWPYKIVSDDEDNGKWIYRKVRLRNRGNTSYFGRPLNFSRDMYYSYYPTSEGNPYIEKNPNQ